VTQSSSTQVPLFNPTESVQLSPSFSLPVALVILAIPLAFLQPFVSGAIALFGLFLLFQTVSLRLLFTPDALDVYRGDTLIRRFPYQDWQNWEIFWTPVPILFYFKEVKSIHFLPVLFDPKMLKHCLEYRVPKADIH
jgi:Protein of unknown function (DUF3119)